MLFLIHTNSIVSDRIPLKCTTFNPFLMLVVVVCPLVVLFSVSAHSHEWTYVLLAISRHSYVTRPDRHVCVKTGSLWKEFMFWFSTRKAKALLFNNLQTWIIFTFLYKRENFVLNLNIKSTKVYWFAIKPSYVVMSQVLHACILYDDGDDDDDDDYHDGRPGARSSIPPC